MIINYQFEDHRRFMRERYSHQLSALIVTAKVNGEEVTVAERHSANSDGFIVSIQVQNETQKSFDFALMKETLEEMGGKITPITLIKVEEFRGWMDK